MRKELAWLRRGAPARTSKPKFRIDAANALIADVPPLRDTGRAGQAGHRAAGQGRRRPAGRVGVATTVAQVLRDVEWRIAPGERTGILGANGAGKSTLLGLIAGTVSPTAGRVKRGKTVQVGDARPAGRRCSTSIWTTTWCAR